MSTALPRPAPSSRTIPFTTGIQVLDDLLRCPGIRTSSRQWLLWSQFSHTNGYCSLSPQWQAAQLGVPVSAIMRGAREIVRHGMFEQDEDGRYQRVYLPGETPAEFERREQRHPGLEARLAIGWVLACLAHRTGVARRTGDQLSADACRHRATVERALADLVHAGIISRYGGHGRVKMTFSSGSADGPLRDSLMDRYGPHREPGLTPLHSSRSVANSSRSVANSSRSDTRAIYSPNKAEESRPKLRVAEGVTISPGTGDPSADLAGPEYNNQAGQEEPEKMPPAVKVVDLFPERQVVPAVTRSSGGTFVRQADVILIVAQLLAMVRRDRSRQHTEPSQVAAWTRQIARLCRRLDDPCPSLRVHRVVSWYLDHWGDDKYIPRVESGGSLLEKFDRLEAAMDERTAKDPDETPRDVIRASMGSGTMLLRFEETVLLPASRLHLTGDQVALARALVDLHDRMRAERAAARVGDELASQLGGLVDLLRRYVAWIGERDWSATLKVLQSDSPSFTQFRREAARLDARDRDPITGRMR